MVTEKMPMLKYYIKEYDTYRDYGNIKFREKDAIRFIHSYCNYVNVKPPLFKVKKLSKNVLANYCEERLLICYSDKFLIQLHAIAHELGHHLDTIRNGAYRKNRERRRNAHQKLHSIELKRVLMYWEKIYKTQVLKADIKTPSKDIVQIKNGAVMLVHRPRETKI